MRQEPTLGDFEQLILLALVRLADQAYGVSIHDEIVRRARRDVTVAAVYKTLERLEDKGLIVSTLGPPTAERGGPPQEVLPHPARRPTCSGAGTGLPAPDGRRAGSRTGPRA
jgi:hypothetical protein